MRERSVHWKALVVFDLTCVSLRQIKHNHVQAPAQRDCDDDVLPTKKALVM